MDLGKSGSKHRPPDNNQSIVASGSGTNVGLRQEAQSSDSIDRPATPISINEDGLHGMQREQGFICNPDVKVSDDPVWVSAIETSSGENVKLMYDRAHVIGSGSFGMVFVARLEGGQEIAIKKILQVKKFKDRELSTLKILRHPNIVNMLYYFYSSSAPSKEIFLNLVLEFIPQTLARIILHYSQLKQLIPLYYVRFYSFQIIRGLAYIHSKNICHRDIKPQNLLVNPENSILKICDFGSAKILLPDETNISYICSRYYRAPELIFGTTRYTLSIDMWSVGCVLGELLLGRTLFRGQSSIDQLVEIIKILGTPTIEQVYEMNPNYSTFSFPNVNGCTWEKLISDRSDEEAFELLRRVLVYSPSTRLSASEALNFPFFNMVISPSERLSAPQIPYIPINRFLPQLSDFTEEEFAYLDKTLVSRIETATEEINRVKINDSQNKLSSNSDHGQI